MSHTVIYVTVVTSLMTLLMKEFISNVMDDPNLDETHVNYPNNKVGYILHFNIYVIKI